MNNKFSCWICALVAGLVLWLPAAGAADGDTGKELYIKYCSACHGKDGKGNGSVTPYLKIRVPDLTLLRKNNKGIFPFARVMSSMDSSRAVRAHGEPSMPVWGEVFEKEVEAGKYPILTSLYKVKAIAEYVSTIQR